MPSGSSNNETTAPNKTLSSFGGNKLLSTKVSSALLPPLASPDPDTSNYCCIGGINSNMNVDSNSSNSDNSNSNKYQHHQDSTLDISTSSLVGQGHVSISPIVCRICYSTCGTLYAFCKCKGSVGYVHKECLKRWIDAKLKANKCEICQAPFSGTDWSFKPINRWASPKMGVLDKLYLALFICCSIIVLYSIPWISYKAWRSRDVIFGDGPVTSERVFALIVIAIYVPLNISCIASLVVLWRRAVAGVCQRFLDANKMWRVKVTREVAETKLINAINSTNKSPVAFGGNKKAGDDDDDDDRDPLAMTPIKRLSSSPRRPGVPKISTSPVDDVGLMLTNIGADSSAAMLITPMTPFGSSATSTMLDPQMSPNSTCNMCSNTLRSFGPTEV